MNDIVKEIGFPIGIVAFVISWVEIRMGNKTWISILILFLSMVIISFMNSYNRKEYLKED